LIGKLGPSSDMSVKSIQSRLVQDYDFGIDSIDTDTARRGGFHLNRIVESRLPVLRTAASVFSVDSTVFRTPVKHGFIIAQPPTSTFSASDRTRNN
jgi:hypothetical protein